MKITQKQVQDLFEYRNGALYRKTTIPYNSRIKIGDRVGNIRKDGYIMIGINGKHYLEHRIIYLYHRGYLPEILDHKDGNPTNNNIENLRSVTYNQNNQNTIQKGGTSKFKGISWFKRDNKWRATIMCNYRNIHLGLFDNEQDAARAYNCVALNLFGEFARINKIDEETDRFFDNNN